VRITPSVSGFYHGHIGHQGDEDIIPPFVYKGRTYSQNWDAKGQATFNAGCALPASSRPLTPARSSTPPTQQTGACPATTTTTERVLVGVWHATGSYKNGQRKYVFMTPSLGSAHYTKHEDDKPAYETRTVRRTASGENCATVTSSSNTTGTANNQSSPQATQSTQAPQSAQTSKSSQKPQSRRVAASPRAQASASGVAGAVSPTRAGESKARGGVRGTVARAPRAIADTATTGTLPFTGIPLWIAALIGGALLAVGLGLRRTA
jgi:cobalamin biosynthesis Mg chelatase CobN